MSAFFRALGMVIFSAWLLGCFDVIDFNLCIQPVGKCNNQATKEPR